MFTEIAHLPKLLSISSSIVEIFLSIRICGFQMPITSKFDFSQVGDPKGVHQGYHEMTYTKFGRGRSFCKNEVGGGGRARGGYFPVFRIYHDFYEHLNTNLTYINGLKIIFRYLQTLTQ